MIIHFTTTNEKRPIPPKYNDLQVEHGRHKKISIKLDRQCSQTAIPYHKYKNLLIFRSSLQNMSINKLMVLFNNLVGDTPEALYHY